MPARPLVLFGNGSHLNLGCQAIDVGTACGFAELGVGEITFMPARLPFDASVVAEASGATVRVDGALQLVLSSMRTRIVRKLAGALPPAIRPRLIAIYVDLPAAASARGALALGGDNYSLDYGPPDVFFGVNRSIARAGVPLFMWGASVGPFDSMPRYERMVVAELNTTSGIFAREDVTAGYLAGLGVETPVIRMSDPAFLMPARAVKDANLQPRLDGAIGVNLSPLIGEKQRKTPAQWVEDCAAIVTSLVNKFDRPIILVPHVTVPGSDDRALMSGVLARLDEKTLDVTQLLPDGLDALETKWMIGQMAAFVGARTHATIAAMSQGVPTVSVGYSAKAVGINLDVLGHDRFVIGLDELSVDALNGRVDMLLRESDSVSETLRAALPEVQARARSGFEQLLSILDSPNGGMIRDA